MHKTLGLCLAASAFLYAGERVELFGTFVDMNGSLSHIGEDPLITYKDQILSADEIVYDSNRTLVEAKGSINLFKEGKYHLLGEYAAYNIEKDTQYLKPYYMFDQETGVWMSTAEAQGCDNKIDLVSGSVSGCNSSDPLWKIRFSRAKYDMQSSWVDLYNARLEVGALPVFYLPYFGYATDRKRRTGLLVPSFGFSGSEGFYYQQPIYFAPRNWWDAELRPQIRTSRGEGLYSDIRFIDTPSSQGSIRLGYFQEQASYKAEKNLAHLKHYGYGLNYRHREPLREWFDLPLEGASGLYVNGSWMNDVDYLNLQHSDETRNVIANQVISRINTYYSSEDNYVGSYLKHYQYLDQSNNAQTIQTLPSLHYHRYLESLFNNHLLINADATATNFYRAEGKKAVEGNLNIPLTLQGALLNEYLDLSYTANATGKMIGFYGNKRSDEVSSLYEQGIYAQLDHTVTLGSTLVRPYTDMTHVMNPHVSYTFAGKRYYNGYYDTYHGACGVGNTNPACEYYTLNEPSDSLALGLNNYLFKEGKSFVVDRISQNFRYNDQGNAYGELQNELEWEITKEISFYNQTAYNHDRNVIAKEQNTVRYNGETVTAGVSHYYTDQVRNTIPVYASYWTADAAYQYNRNYRFSGLVAYDYREDLMKRGEVGFLYTTRCLDFGLKLVQNRRPILTNAIVNNAVNDTYVFITVILKPIGGSAFNYKLTNN